MKNKFHISVFFLSLIGLIKIWHAIFIEKSQYILDFDVYFNSLMTNLHTSEKINQFFIFITHLFDPKIFLLWFFFLLGILLWNKKKYEAMFLFFGVAGSQTIKIVMKWMTDRSRPENPFDLYVHESSFPSGHATTAIFIAIAIAYLFTKKLSKYKKLMLNAGLLAIALLVSFSRIFTQVHYFSDVATGIILAVGSFSFTVLFFTFLHLKYKNTSFYSKIFN